LARLLTYHDDAGACMYNSYSDDLTQGDLHPISDATTEYRVGVPSAKRFSVEENEGVRAALKRYVADVHGGNRTAAAETLGISQAHVSEILNGRRGAGMRSLSRLAEALGVSLDVIVGREPWPTTAEQGPAELYPNRAIAIAAWRSQLIEDLGEDPAVLDEVVAEMLSRQSEGPDLSPNQWMKALSAELRNMRFRRQR